MGLSGNGHIHALHFNYTPRRVVSLVPSLTESLFDLGLGECLVGVTDYCQIPKAHRSRIIRLGGPKDARLQAILGIKPDLVLANQEENSQTLVEALEAEGIRVWVSFPRTVRQAVDVLWVLVGLFTNRQAALQLATLEQALDWAEASWETWQPWRYFCPVWQELPGEILDQIRQSAWWMTFNQETYPHDLLRLMGGQNVFASRLRLYPLEADLGRAAPEPAGIRDTRYPRVTYAEILQADPEVILLPSEPFAYTQSHLEQFQQVFPHLKAVGDERVVLVDGSLLTWHGTRLGRALTELPTLFSAFAMGT